MYYPTFGAGDWKRGFVGIDLNNFLVLIDLLTIGNKPFGELYLGNGFTRTGNFYFNCHQLIFRDEVSSDKI
jgi:hypothetical protein